jgi:hypothetical protein
MQSLTRRRPADLLKLQVGCPCRQAVQHEMKCVANMPWAAASRQRRAATSGRRLRQCLVLLATDYTPACIEHIVCGSCCCSCCCLAATWQLFACNCMDACKRRCAITRTTATPPAVPATARGLAASIATVTATSRCQPLDPLGDQPRLVAAVCYCYHCYPDPVGDSFTLC